MANRSPANAGEASGKEGGVDFHFDVLIAPCRVRQTQEKKRKLIRLLLDLRIPLLHHPLSRYPDFTCKTQCRSPRKPQFRLTWKPSPALSEESWRRLVCSLSTSSKPGCSSTLPAPTRESSTVAPPFIVRKVCEPYGRGWLPSPLTSHSNTLFEWDPMLCFRVPSRILRPDSSATRVGFFPVSGRVCLRLLLLLRPLR